MGKLEILGQFIKKYPDWINEALVYLKFCQNGITSFLEMYFCNNVDIPDTIDLEFIGNTDKMMFNPDADIVDNAKSFIELDTYTLINCIENLFTHEAEIIINRNYLDNIK